MVALLRFLPPWLSERCRVSGAEATTDKAPKAIVYWMRVVVRDHENPALDVARMLACNLGVPFMVVHALSERYPYASDRHHTFILEGARDVQAAFRARGIPYAFHLERGVRTPALKKLAARGCMFVTELMPTGPMRTWTQSLAEHAPVVEVDASCIFPMPSGLSRAPSRAFEFRKEAAPRTATLVAEGYPAFHVEGALRPLTELPFEPILFDQQSVGELVGSCAIDHSVGPVPDSPGGMHAGYARWRHYLETQLPSYARTRNDPLADSASRMSAYLHYGHVSPFRLAHELHMLRTVQPSSEKLLDELLIWRELAWHHAYHDPSHTTYASIPTWARETLAKHEGDARASFPSLDQLARGDTDDALWNVCQRSLLAHGELHNNVRMTWGKKLLEWTRTGEEAFNLLVDLNHRYALDGRDPASYGGIRWCFGAFDRPFAPATRILGEVRPRPSSVHRERLDVDVYGAWTARSPFARSPRVAVLGSGMAGLAAARVLQNHAIDVTVFDKGKRVGGRVVSRQLLGVPFDYGAQYITAHSELFANLTGALKWEGVLESWTPRTFRNGKKTDATLDAEAWLVAPSGFSAFAARLAQGLHVVQSKHVACNERVEGTCRLAFADGTTEDFDEVMVTVPGPQQPLLVSDAPAVGGYAPCWSLSLAFAGKLAPPFDVAVSESGPLAWVSRESSKPGRENANVDVWTLHASTSFSETHLEVEPEQVLALLLQAFAALLREHGVKMSEPLEHHVHKWRFARAHKHETRSYAHALGIGFAGDAFGGPRVESAYLSGVALAGDLVRRLAGEGAGVRHA